MAHSKRRWRGWIGSVTISPSHRYPTPPVAELTGPRRFDTLPPDVQPLRIKFWDYNEANAAEGDGEPEPFGPGDCVLQTSMQRQGWRLLARAPRLRDLGEDVTIHSDPTPGVAKFAVHYAMQGDGQCFQGDYFECRAGADTPGARGAEARAWATFEARRRGLTGDARAEFVSGGA